MVDYLAWSKADPLTAEQAARLWAEVDPSTPSYALAPAQSAAIAARLQMLAGKITLGVLKSDTRSNALAFIGRHETSLVLRSELKALAISIDERPAFLFFNESPDGLASLGDKRTFGEVASTDRRDQDSRNQAIETLSHRPGSPRRLSKAPPPPPTVGGGGAVWEFPAKEPQKAMTDQSSGAGASTSSSFSETEDIARLTKEILARRDRGDIHDRDAMRLWTKREIRHMTSDEADALYYQVPDRIRKSRTQGRPSKRKSGRV